MQSDKFDEFFNLHIKWQQGILIDKQIKSGDFEIQLSPINSELFSFAYPTKAVNLESVGLEELKASFTANNRNTSICIPDPEAQFGLREYLVRNGFDYFTADTWMYVDTPLSVNKNSLPEIVEVDANNFADFEQVLGKVFSDFSGMSVYLNICKSTLGGSIKSIIPDLTLKLYLIYKGEKPVSGAGLFYSVAENIGYLHCAGTLESARKKGYQSSLIKHRVFVANQAGITRLYSLVEKGSQSWKNLINCGFNDIKTSEFYKFPRVRRIV